MSSKRDRPPSGRTNVQSGRGQSQSPYNSMPNSPYSIGNSTICSYRDRPATSASPRKSALPAALQPSPQIIATSVPSGIAAPAPLGKQSETGSGQKGEARPKTASSSRPESSSARSEESELSTGEVLRRMREKSEFKRREIESAEIDALGDYNAFSRPRFSTHAPLRSVLLDPETNNFPRSRTRSELMKRIRYASMPHPSYDLDNDGYVSTEDYKLAKRFDFDGNGVLDPDERNIGKQVLADEFFKRHEQDLHNFGGGFAGRSHKENVEKLVHSYSFERSYGQLLQVERTLKAESGKPLLECIQNDQDPAFQRHKYFENKMDSTAWTDFTRLPRASWMTLSDPAAMSSSSISRSRPATAGALPPSTAAPFATNGNCPFALSQSSDGMGHCGSRKRLLFTRQQQLRLECDARSRQLLEQKPQPHTRRVNLITDVAKENS